MFSFDKFKLDETGKFSIYGQAMIYYCDYDNKDDIKYAIYLIDDSSKFIKINCKTQKSNYDYKTMLKSSYNMDYICFKAEADLSTLEPGTYQMIIKIVNGDNVDFLEMTNVAHVSVPEIKVGETDYRFFTSTIRERLMLEVK